jgi:hypothetical protein
LMRNHPPPRVWLSALRRECCWNAHKKSTDLTKCSQFV